MARHYIGAAKPRSEKPRAEIRAAPSFYEKTHPIGSAERFLDEAAKEALVAAAAGGVITPRQAVVGAAKAVAGEAERYPDPLLAEAAKLPREELMKRAARAAMHQRAMEAQNAAVRVASAFNSPTGNMVANNTALTTGEMLGTQQAVGGGDSVSENPGSVSENPGSVPENPGSVSTGPRIVINPTTFRNKKDALCVAFNEGFRLWMEATGFEPQSEPTAAQRKFFSDTAYADDEVQLRRTILARIATFDTSVKDPTDDQLSETASFLGAVLESDWCKNEWERNSVSRLMNAVQSAVGAEPVEPRQEPLEAREAEPLQRRAAMGGGETEDEEERRRAATQFAEERGMSTEGFEDMDAQTVESVYAMHDEQAQGTAEPSPEAQTEQAQTEQSENEHREAVVGDKILSGGNSPEQTQAEQEREQAPAKRNGTQSGVWTGGEEGKGRQLTAREAEWMRQRIDSGASVSGSQLAMFGLSRSETGQLVNANGELHKGFDTAVDVRKNPDAGLDRRNDRRGGPVSRRRT